LIEKNTFVLPLWSFQGARARAHHEKNRPGAGLSKLNSVRRSYVEVDVVPGEPATSDGRSHRRDRRLQE